jgi:hypothetical protein
MAAELITPCDEVSGLPLPFAPAEITSLEGPGFSNWHHLFHPASAPQLQSVGGKALRNCRTQLVIANLHNMREGSYHSVFKGPPLPDADDSESQFFYCVLACAGYVPAKGIDMTSVRPEIPITLSESQVQLIRAQAQPKMVTNREFHNYMKKYSTEATPKKAWRRLEVLHNRNASLSYEQFSYGYEPIRDFFRSYVIEHDIDISSKVIKRFLSALEGEQRRSLGETILAAATSQATMSIRDRYRSLHEAGGLHPSIPPKPEKLVFTKLGNYKQRERVIANLHSRLTLQYS